MRDAMRGTKQAQAGAVAHGGRPRQPTRSKEEMARLGDAIYQRDIRRQVEAEHHGRIVAIDVDSGRWAMADGLLEAVDLLHAQWPEAINVFSLRVGHRTLGKFGFRSFGMVK